MEPCVGSQIAKDEGVRLIGNKTVANIEVNFSFSGTEYPTKNMQPVNFGRHSSHSVDREMWDFT